MHEFGGVNLYVLSEEMSFEVFFSHMAHFNENEKKNRKKIKKAKFWKKMVWRYGQKVTHFSSLIWFSERIVIEQYRKYIMQTMKHTSCFAVLLRFLEILECTWFCNDKFQSCKELENERKSWKNKTAWRNHFICKKITQSLLLLVQFNKLFQAFLAEI